MERKWKVLGITAMLGIAVLVAILETASPAGPVAPFKDAWTLMTAIAVGRAA